MISSCTIFLQVNLNSNFMSMGNSVTCNTLHFMNWLHFSILHTLILLLLCIDLNFLQVLYIYRTYVHKIGVINEMNYLSYYHLH